jgi:hypothetical protein
MVILSWAVFLKKKKVTNTYHQRFKIKLIVSVNFKINRGKPMKLKDLEF